jgi:hypothetical protein
VDFVRFDEDARAVRINPDKHFECITPVLWNYHIGGFQMLQKNLKDRKGKSLADPIHYCRVATALALTIELQSKVDQIIENVIQ